MRRVYDDSHFDEVFEKLNEMLEYESKPFYGYADVRHIVDKIKDELGFKLSNKIETEDKIRYDVIYITPEEEQICCLIHMIPEEDRYSGDSLTVYITDIDEEKEYGHYHIHTPND